MFAVHTFLPHMKFIFVKASTPWVQMSPCVYYILYFTFFLRATRGTSNPNLQIYVCSHHSFGLQLRMNGIERKLIWCAFWPSKTCNLIAPFLTTYAKHSVGARACWPSIDLALTRMGCVNKAVLAAAYIFLLHNRHGEVAMSIKILSPYRSWNSIVREKNEKTVLYERTIMQWDLYSGDTTGTKAPVPWIEVGLGFAIIDKNKENIFLSFCLGIWFIISSS